MTLHWKRTNDGNEFAAMWRNQHLRLIYDPYTGTLGRPWHLLVEDVRVARHNGRPAQWSTPRQAQEAIDVVVDRQLIQLGKQVVAVQHGQMAVTA